MDARVPLPRHTQLRFRNREGGTVVYTLGRELSRGGSCIVYDACYETNAADCKHVRVKECYPSRLRITRAASGELIPFPEDREAFAAACRKFRADFSLGNGLFYAQGLFDALTNTLDIYEGNGTIYLVSAYSPESTLATYRPTDLKACIRLVRQVSQILKRIHSEGYLYLDLKPENVLVSDSYTTRVQLFDFDSLLPLGLTKSSDPQDFGNLRLSYSKGFAAIELQTAKLRRLGPHTDVYGVGALLFYLLFGVTPRAADCEPDAAFDYSSLQYPSDHQDKLYFALTDFFRNALANYYLDRYHDMQQVIDALAELEVLADSALPYIRSTCVAGPALLVGRQQELQQLGSWYESESPCIFVTGMGGIGKSALVREFLSQKRAHLDSLLYLSFSGSLAQTLADDHTAAISTVSRDPRESFAEYYARKLASLRSIVAGTRAVLVVDQYPGGISPELQQILSVGWKVILISRQETPGYPQLSVEAIANPDDRYALVEHHIGRGITDQERPFVDQIITRIAGHTLVLELIAKQIAASYLTLEQAAGLVQQCGFSRIAPEKVWLQKDQLATLATIRSILTALFAADQISRQQQALVKVLALPGEQETEILLLQEALQLPSKEEINALVRSGWLQLHGRSISLHPVMLETVRTWQWTPESLQMAERLLQWLLQESQIRERLTEETSREQRSWLERCFSAGRSNGTAAQPAASPERQHTLLQLSEAVCRGSRDVPALKTLRLDLLYSTVVRMPRHREDTTLELANQLVREPEARNGVALVKLYHCILEICQERSDREAAQLACRQAGKLAKQNGSHEVLALYYDLEADHYDACLNGAYQTASREEELLLRKLNQALEKASYHADRSDAPACRQLLAKMLLARATVRIRSNPEKKRSIDSLLQKAKAIVMEQVDDQLQSIYHMVCAWYATAVEPSLETALACMEKAKAICDKLHTASLDEIDSITIPCADMLCCWAEYAASAALLLEGIQICEQSPAVVPYMRKKLDLYSYLLDVYQLWNKPELVRQTLTTIREHNQRYSAYGIYKELPPDLLAALQET